jgi:hypothetical protein
MGLAGEGQGCFGQPADVLSDVDMEERCVDVGFGQPSARTDRRLRHRLQLGLQVGAVVHEIDALRPGPEPGLHDDREPVNLGECAQLRLRPDGRESGLADAGTGGEAAHAELVAVGGGRRRCLPVNAQGLPDAGGAHDVVLLGGEDMGHPVAAAQRDGAPLEGRGAVVIDGFDDVIVRQLPAAGGGGYSLRGDQYKGRVRAHPAAQGTVSQRLVIENQDPARRSGRLRAHLRGGTVGPGATQIAWSVAPARFRR